MISIIILSFNGADGLTETLEAAVQVSDDIHVVDSYSTDDSQEIARRYGAHVVEHAFSGYADQRQWASDNLNLKYAWELHLDQDDVLSPELINELNSLQKQFPDNVTGYFIGRCMYFLGKPIHHGGMYPSWQMRLFRKGTGRCELRKYDCHFFVSGPTKHLKHDMIDRQSMTLSEWTARQNHWSDYEAIELDQPTLEGVVPPRLFGNVVQRRRLQHKFYDSLPLFVRAFALFFYRYFLRLGFLDGRHGLIFFGLQCFWWRFLVDAKLHERRQARAMELDAGSTAGETNNGHDRGVVADTRAEPPELGFRDSDHDEIRFG